MNTEPCIQLYRSQVLTDDLGGTYNKFVTKKDVVWISDRIQIDVPLESNGGDVILFADHIVVNAAIDTRVRISTYGRYWEHESPPAGVIWKGTIHNFDVILYWEKDRWPIFNDLRFWEDRFDAASRQYKYQGLTSYPMTTYSARRDGHGWPMPIPHFPYSNYQLPSGLISYERNGPTEGKHAPNEIVDRVATKSGSIYVFCRQLDLGTEVGPQVWTRSQFGDDFDFDRPVFFQTGGLKGGRGGSGSLMTSQPSRRDRSRKGGISGNPGRGGDAGSVFFTFFGDGNKSVQDEQSLTSDALLLQHQIHTGAHSGSDIPTRLRQSTSFITNVLGGYPPYCGYRHVTDNLNEIAAAKDRLAPFTKTASIDEPLPDLMGMPGDIVYRHCSILEALDELHLRLAQIDARAPAKLSIIFDPGNQYANTSQEANDGPLSVDHDVKRRNDNLREWLHIAAGSRTPHVLQWSAKAVFVAFLERQLAAAAISTIACALKEPVSVPGSFLAEGLIEISTLNVPFDDVEVQLLRTIAAFRSIEGFNAVQSYFLRTGGVYSLLSNVDVSGVNYNAETVNALHDLEAETRRLVENTILEREQSIAYWSKYFNNQYQERIAHLNAQLQSLRARLKHDNALSTRLEIGFAEIQKQAGVAATAYGSSQYWLMAVAVWRMIDVAREIVSFTPSTEQGLVDLIQAVNNDFRAFAEDTRQRIVWLLSDRNELLKSAIEADARYRALRRVEWLRFGTFFRSIFQNRFSNPHASDLFVSNLHGLRSLLATERVLLPLELTSTKDECMPEMSYRSINEEIGGKDREQPIPCATFDASQDMAAFASFPNYFAVPLLSQSGDFSLPRDIKAKMISLVKVSYGLE